MKERDESYNMRRQYTVSSSAFTVPSIISRKNVCSLGNEISMFFQPIPSASGTDKCVEIRLSMDRMQIQKTFSFRWRTVLCVSFFFFCQLTSIVESHGISQIDELSLRENIDALPRAILSIVLCTKDENLFSNRWLNLSLIFLVANVFSKWIFRTHLEYSYVYIFTKIFKLNARI